VSSLARNGKWPVFAQVHLRCGDCPQVSNVSQTSHAWARSCRAVQNTAFRSLIPHFVSSSIGTTTLSRVSACSNVVEHSQQEGFYRVPLPAARLNPTWRRTRDLERSYFRHERPPDFEATLANPAAEGGNMGEKWPRNFAESDDFHVTFGFFYMP
jgi:hypothetical protein